MGRTAVPLLLFWVLAGATLFLTASGRAAVCERRLCALCSAAPAGFTTGLLLRLTVVLGCVGRRSAAVELR